jgi:HK97 gp10 family phage protein
MSSVRVKGLSELNKFLQQLPAKVEANVLRGALRAGAKPILEQAKGGVPVDTGKLRDGLKISTRHRKGRVTAHVKAGGDHASIAHWIEYGVAAHQITAAKGGWLFFGNGFAKAVNHPGVQARPFMRPALDMRAPSAVIAAAEYMKKRLATKHGLDTADIEITGESDG